MQIKVDLVDSEGEVSGVDGDKDLSTVFDKAYGARLRFRIARTNEDAIENALRPSSSLSVLNRYTHVYGREFTSGIKNCHTRNGPIVSHDTLALVILSVYRLSVMRLGTRR